MTTSKSKARENMDVLLKTSAAKVLAEYFMELQQDETNKLLHCNDDTFRHQQGKASKMKELVDMCTRQYT